SCSGRLRVAVTLERSFLADILENPDDDTPRLVYADWLTERGGEMDLARAEVIRTQIELARTDRYDPAWLAPSPPEDALLSEYLDVWANEPEWDAVTCVAMRRGFVEHVGYEDFPQFLADARRVFALAPITSLEVETVGGYDAQTEKHNGLARVVRSKA